MWLEFVLNALLADARLREMGPMGATLGREL